MAHQPSHQPLDSMDPHHEGHHEHVIVRSITLISVLAVLLFFTLLTVGQAQGELFFSSQFGIKFPPMFNVVVVMAIAVVKASIVALYFMQLRYDNPLNSIIFLFCLFAVGLFLSFTMIDLGNRGIVTPVKDGEIQSGGLGIEVPGKVATGTTPIAVWAKANRIQRIGELAAEGRLTLQGGTAESHYEWEKALFSHAHHGHDDHAAALSTPNMSVPPKPQGPALFEAPHGNDDHGHAH
jgi:cytochrome c oxidase subunit 4